MSQRFSQRSTNYRGQGASVPGSENTPTFRRGLYKRPDDELIAQIGKMYDEGVKKAHIMKALQIGRDKYDKCLSFYLMDKFEKGGE